MKNRNGNMVIGYRARKLLAIGTGITMLAMGLQGCSLSSNAETINTENGSEQGTQESLTWTVLGNLTDVPELRAAWDEILGTTGSAGSKQGPLYVNTKGDPDQNVTLQMALHNKAFLDAYVKDIDKLSEAAGLSYADVDDEETLQKFAIAANGYFNIIPDSQNGYANPNETLTRAQAMSAVMRATTPVSDNITENEDFSGIVGKSEYNKYAQDLDNECFISTKDKSLTPNNYNGKMTKAEAVYMLVNKFFSDDLDALTLDKENVEFDDCINGGNIIAQQPKGESVDASALKSMLDNPEKGVDESIYRAMIVAYDNEIIGDTTDWDTSITKADFMDMLVNSIKESTSMSVFNELYDAVNVAASDVPEIDEINEEDIENTDSTEIKDDNNKDKNKDNNKKKSSKGYEVEKLGKSDGPAKKYVKKTANVRKGPGTKYDKNGTYSAGKEVNVTGKVVTKDGVWYKVGDNKFILSTLLVDKESQVEKPSTNTNTNTNKNNSSSSSSSKNSSSSSKNSSSSSSSKKNNSSSSSSSKKNNSSSSSKKNNSSKNNGGSSSKNNKKDDDLFADYDIGGEGGGYMGESDSDTAAGWKVE